MAKMQQQCSPLLRPWKQCFMTTTANEMQGLCLGRSACREQVLSHYRMQSQAAPVLTSVRICSTMLNVSCCPERAHAAPTPLWLASSASMWRRMES